MDLIDRQAIIDWASKVPIHDLSDGRGLCRVIFAEDLLEALKQLPSAQPERTGRWILHENQRQEDVDNGNYLYSCSECGKSDIHAKTQDVPFCWWCGAKMEVEHE